VRRAPDQPGGARGGGEAEHDQEAGDQPGEDHARLARLRFAAGGRRARMRVAFLASRRSVASAALIRAR
jgi:hypothetical protein